jgi:hypothetical protein
MPSVRLGAVTLALALICAGSCKPRQPDPVEVAGRVEWGAGRPLDGVVITFHPDDEANKKGNLLSAPVERGQFSGKCLPGRYKVTLTSLAGGSRHPAGATDPGSGAAPEKGGGAIPAQFRNATETPLVVTVPPEGKKDILLTVR